ncbi:MAG: ABC transporter substrate-binding protein [Solirubrobacteraceae bacterium]
MARNPRRLDEIRVQRSEIENHYIDEFLAGRLSRRSFLRRGGMIGLSVPTIGAILAACGGANNSSSTAASGAAAAPSKRGGLLRVANQTPTAEVNPLTVTDGGGLLMLCQTGEFLINDDTGRGGQPLAPALALSWRPNANGTVWTFKLRPGVKFHDGSPMTADDVVYTFQQLVDPKNASNALSAFMGILSPAGVVKVNAMTVAFHLEAAIGNFPYLVSSDTYNAIIVPKGTDFGKWQRTFIGTGPWKLQSYTQNVGARFVANPTYWGSKPLLSGTEFSFFTSQQPQLLALEGGQVEVVTAFSAQGAKAVINNPQYTIVRLKSSSHQEMSMRTDQAPFTDPRVRQAVALTLNRPELVQALIDGYGSVGNESPFAPASAFTDTSVAQRTQDLAKAKQLLAAAGHPNGFHTTLFVGVQEELPLLAQAIAADAAKVGITITLKVETLAAYYGKSTFGNSDWLDGTMSLLNYAGRGVPNVVLEAAFTTHGVWNAARFHNRQYDALVKQFVAAVDLSSQRQLAGKIQTLLLAETPVIVPYFIDELNATTSNVHGVYGSEAQQLFLGKAYLS